MQRPPETENPALAQGAGVSKSDLVGTEIDKTEDNKDASSCKGRRLIFLNPDVSADALARQLYRELGEARLINLHRAIGRIKKRAVLLVAEEEFAKHWRAR